MMSAQNRFLLVVCFSLASLVWLLWIGALEKTWHVWLAGVIFISYVGWKK